MEAQSKKVTENVEFEKILEDPSVLKFVLDTNTIFAYLNPKNQFHLEAKTSIDGIKMKKILFILPYIIIGEFIAHRSEIGLKKRPSITKALEILYKFDNELENRLVGGSPMHMGAIISYYKKHSHHHKLTNAGFADFIILAQANEIKNSRILTCDKGMYKCGKTIFKSKIYYLPSKTKDIKSDYPRLMSELQNNFI